MPIVKKVLAYLDGQGVSYSIGREASERNHSFEVVTSLLKDGQGGVVVAYPSNRGVDLSAVRQITHRKLEFSEEKDVGSVLPDVDPLYLPPLGGLWNIPVLVEKTLFSWPYLEFSISPDHYIHIDAKSYAQLFPGRRGFDFAYDRRKDDRQQFDKNIDNEQVVELLNEADGKRGIAQLFHEQTVLTRLENTKALPVMPGVVHQLMRLLANSDANIHDLVEIIEQDQALVSRIISFSRSAHFSYMGNITNVFDAVYRVIGYDDAIRISLAMVFSRQLQGPLDGRVGLKALWVEAMGVAMAARQIASESALNQHLNPGLMYVATLLHNIGYQALAHLFPREYAIFNRMVTSMSDVSLLELEATLSEILPQSVSSKVLSLWNMPVEVLAVAKSGLKNEAQFEHRAYCDGFKIAWYLMTTSAQTQDVPDDIRDIATRYALDINELSENLQKAQIEQEIAFVVDMMLA